MPIHRPGAYPIPKSARQALYVITMKPGRGCEPDSAEKPMKRHELLIQKRPVAKVQRLDQLPAISIPCGRASARVGTRDQTTSLIRLQNPLNLTRSRLGAPILGAAQHYSRRSLRRHPQQRGLARHTFARINSSSLPNCLHLPPRCISEESARSRRKPGCAYR